MRERNVVVEGDRRDRPTQQTREVHMPEATETPVLDLLAEMTEKSIEASSLDPEKLMLVRLAALVAVDAPPVSYDLNLRAASETEVDIDDVRGVLAAIAPIVGTAKIAAATGNIVRALAFELEIAELEAEESD
jgi:carboxymuconolactone decarboxylase family protein